MCMEFKLWASSRYPFQRVLSQGPSVFPITLCPKPVVVHSPARVPGFSALSVQDSWQFFVQQFISYSEFQFFSPHLCKRDWSVVIMGVLFGAETWTLIINIG